MVKPWPTEAGLIFVAQMFRPCFDGPEVGVLESKNETGGELCGGGREPLAVIQGLRSHASLGSLTLFVGRRYPKCGFLMSCAEVRACPTYTWGVNT